MIVLIIMIWYDDDDDLTPNILFLYTSFMYEYISVWWIVSMFILARSNGVIWSCAEEERRWRARPPRRRSCLSATTCSKPSRGWSGYRFLSHTWRYLFLDVMDDWLPLRPGSSPQGCWCSYISNLKFFSLPLTISSSQSKRLLWICILFKTLF